MITSDKVEMIRLNLTIEQAFYLKQVLWNVGGHRLGPRRLMDEICIELGKYTGDFEDLELPPLMIKGSVVMDNYENKA